MLQMALTTGYWRSDNHASSISESCLRIASDKFPATRVTYQAFLSRSEPK